MSNVRLRVIIWIKLTRLKCLMWYCCLPENVSMICVFLITSLNIFLLYLQMPFHAQNPTSSYFLLPSVPSKTVVESMSLRTSHDCKFIQISFLPNRSFYTFQHTERHQGSIEAAEQCSVPSIHHSLGLNVQKQSVVDQSYRNYSFSNITSCDWYKVSMQIKLPLFTSNLCLLFSGMTLFHKAPWKKKMLLLTFFLNLSFS